MPRGEKWRCGIGNSKHFTFTTIKTLQPAKSAIDTCNVFPRTTDCFSTFALLADHHTNT